jgi:general secretion pathway protein E
MGARHPLPYGFAKAHTLLLEDDGHQLTLWSGEHTPPAALSEVLRVYAVQVFEREAQASLAQRIAAAYAGGESSAATVIGEVESAVDLGRLMQDLPAVEDLLEAANDAPIIRMLNALLTQAAKDGASDIHIEPYERNSSVRFRVDGTLREVVQPNRALHAALISTSPRSACRRTAASRCASAGGPSTCASPRCRAPTANAPCCVCWTRATPSSRSNRWA